MNDQSDSQLLDAWTETRAEPAFTELVRRHLDFVYSAALRMVCDPHLAQDVTQGVFLALAKSAAQLSECQVLSSWLHRTAQNIAAQTVRTIERRRAREQEALAMNQLLATESDAAWEHIAPHLDAALGELTDPDRDAVLLRYFERKSASEMAQILGTSEDAAQKRVSRAVERLREFFAKRGVTVGASGLVVVISANAVQAAPVGLAVTISTAAAFVGTTIATTATATAIKTIAMTTLQKALVAAIVVASVVTPVLFQRQAQARLREQDESLQQRANRLAKLQVENERLASKPAQVKSSQPLPDDQFRELLRLRGEVGRWRREVVELSQPEAKARLSRDDKLASIAKLYAERVSQLKQSLETNPAEKIPELQLLTDSQWLQLSSIPEFDAEDGYRRAMSKARGWAESVFVNDQLNPALQGYAKANNGQFPSDLSQLKPYFKSVVDDAILQRWEIVPANELARHITAQALAAGDDRLIAPKAPVNLALDMPTVCSLSKVTSFASKPARQWVRAR